MSQITRYATIEESIVVALDSYVKGRADEIISRHIERSSEEIRKAVREEVTKVILTLHEMVSVSSSEKNLVITIADRRNGTVND